MRYASDDPNTRTGIDPEDRRPETPDGPYVPEMRFPGADEPAPLPGREDNLPERLGKRIEDGPGDGGIATGVSDLLPDVEIPEASM